MGNKQEFPVPGELDQEKDSDVRAKERRRKDKAVIQRRRDFLLRLRSTKQVELESERTTEYSVQR